MPDVLNGIGQEEYGEHYRDHVVRVYQLYLGLADNVSARRERANSFFLAVNTALVALLSKGLLGGDSSRAESVGFLAPVAGLILCVLWDRIIRSYRDLNSAKFKVIHEIERQLPLRPYDAEWESVGRGNNPGRYIPLTHVELVVPWVFFGLHAILVSAHLS